MTRPASTGGSGVLFEAQVGAAYLAIFAQRPENVWSAVRLQGKSAWVKKVCVNVSGLCMESFLLTMMRYARVRPNKVSGRRRPFSRTGFRHAALTVLSS
jgi:hypothetical protein